MAWWNGWRDSRGWWRSQDDFSAEIRAHVDAETDALIADGMTPEDACATALRKSAT